MLYVTLYIVLSAIFAVIGYNMAKQRHRDAGTWGVVCFLTGFIGIIVLAWIGESSAKHTSNRTASGSTLPEAQKWKVLVEIDPDIAAAAHEVRTRGERFEGLLAEKYMAVNDKSYLPSILEKTLEEIDKITEFPPEGDFKKNSFRQKMDGSYVITRGKYVGRVFDTYPNMMAFLEDSR